MIKGIIFDFDGLIVDTESLWFEVYQDLFQEYKVPLALDLFSQVIGTTDELLQDYFYEKTGVPLTDKEILARQEELFQRKADQLQLRDGVVDYLKEAENLQLKVGLASSSSRAWVETYLKRFDIHHHFNTIKTKEDVERVKPDPALYRKAVEALAIEPEEAIAFEDSLNGSNAAITAGLKCVVVPNPVTVDLPFEHYHARLSSMAEKGLEAVIREVTTSGFR